MSWDVPLSEGGSTLQGHIRRRGPSGSWEYILDVGRYGAQRCQVCDKRFWTERRPEEACPACGGELRETEERRRETKGGFASRKDCQAALTRKLSRAGDEGASRLSSQLYFTEVRGGTRFIGRPQPLAFADNRACGNS